MVRINQTRFQAGDITQVELVRTQLAALQLRNFVRRHEIQLRNPERRFRPHMFGQVIHSGRSREVPVVPPGAVVYQGGRSLLLVTRENGLFEPREVQVGGRSDGLLPILQGVEPGEQVVVNGAMLLLGH